MLLRGIATDLRSDREGATTVLRFLLSTDSGRKMAVEMRGRQLSGMISESDEVELTGRRTVGRDGVARPTKVRNLTTDSLVRTRQVRMRRLAATVTRVAVSLGTGALSTVVASGAVESAADVTTVVFSANDGVASAPEEVSAVSYLPIAAGVLIAVLVMILLLRVGRR